VAIQLKDADFPDYFRADLNPKWHAALIRYASNRIDPRIKANTDLELHLPSVAVQTRIGFETQCLRHHTQKTAARLDHFPPDEESALDATTLRTLIQQRCQDVVKMSCEMPPSAHIPQSQPQ
jgi:hypothetical protein